MKNIIFIAPPSAGKGTQSKLLEEKYGYKHLSTGDLLRKEINTGSPLGLEIKELIDQGKLVDDELITQILSKEITNHDSFILDGYPRNINQAEMLDTILKDIPYLVIYLEISKNEAMKRVLGRMICENCGLSYNIYNEKLKPSVEGICDKCNMTLTTRNDDNEATFNNRFDTYLKETKPLIEFYENKNKLKTIKVEDDRHLTFEKIAKTLNEVE